MKKKKIYFPNLNGLRFIAAFLVIIHHIEQFKSIIKVENYWGKIPFINIIGKLGVILFFVLSGFLITYLLLAEEKAFKKISIAKFYMRRVLRIWPLYFLIIILAFFVLPNIEIFILPSYGKDVIYTNLFWKLLLYAIFFPNLVLSLLGVVPYASHTWSIGTEEQYYLVWPVILKHIKKYRILLMFAIILFYLSFKFFLRTSYAYQIPYNNVLRAFWNSFPIDCMAIGALYSILLFQKSKFLKYLVRNDLFYFSIGLVTFLMLKGVYIPYIHYEFYSFFFGVIILNFAVNEKIKISLENKIFNYLGNISYGLYMYHPIGIILAISIISSFDLKTNWILYPLSFILTITMASLSYKYFESFFLQFKDKFSNILSGNRKIE
ncbi:acyltransferase family protein [Polaribacter butkevichii]|uniref:Acyltransferase 3 domain-containing protein n=1 Tax=Polaribacter butkevichii TaxID=218490 RepID=A0A2P6CEZ5_9FLAO|nr:acyltransferase [Polaribacter butkevichii]PQJ73448.1 hypothetical protein BTO14_09315 [Polaribacter butkevichii]